MTSAEGGQLYGSRRSEGKRSQAGSGAPGLSPSMPGSSEPSIEHAPPSAEAFSLGYWVRIVRVASIATAMVLAVVVAYMVLPGHQPLVARTLLVAIGLAALGLVGANLVPWRRLYASEMVLPVLWAWSISDIVLISWGVALSGGGRSDLWVLYALPVVFMVVYPLIGQLCLILLTCGAYLTTVASAGGPIHPAVLELRLGILVVLFAMASLLGRQLKGEAIRHFYAKEEATRRAGLMHAVADSATRMQMLDFHAVATTAVDAVVAIGFEVAAVATGSGHGKLRCAQCRGLRVLEGDFSGDGGDSGEGSGIILDPVHEAFLEEVGRAIWLSRVTLAVGIGQSESPADRRGRPGQKYHLRRKKDRELQRQLEGHLAVDEPAQVGARLSLETGGDVLDGLRSVMAKAGLVFAVLCPLRRRGELVGVLLGATRSSQLHLPEAIEAQELQALLVGQALDTASYAQELRLNEDRFRVLAEGAPIGIFLADSHGTPIYMNERYRQVVRAKTGGGFPTRSEWLDIVHLEDRPAVEAAFNDLRRGSPEVSVQCRVTKLDGQPAWISMRISRLQDDSGLPRGFVGTMEDITDRQAAFEVMAKAAMRDPLTGLYNRVAFGDRLDEALSRSRRSGERVAVLFMDLDRLKLVNDQLGHESGDELLKVISERIVSAVRPEDCVARFGGDEFVVLCEGISDPEVAAVVAERMLSVVGQPLAIAGVHMAPSVSVGVSCSGAGGQGIDAPGLLRQADSAMYSAKQHGGGRFEIYAAGLHQRGSRRRQHTELTDEVVAAQQARKHPGEPPSAPGGPPPAPPPPSNKSPGVPAMSLEGALSHAVEADQLHLVYQPIMDLKTFEIAGAEALLRWEHPFLGSVLPRAFLPVAEQTGLIIAIGEWVLYQACRDLAHWRLVLPARRSHPMWVAVNISAHQVRNPAFPYGVLSAIERTGLSPWEVLLELHEEAIAQIGAGPYTESVPGGAQAADAAITMLADNGVKLAVDEFGSGPSPLGRLGDLRITAIKIDRRLLSKVAERRDDAAAVGRIVDLAHQVGVAVVAQDVETASQLNELKRLRCDFAQGFYLGSPVTAEGIAQKLRSPRAPVSLQDEGNSGQS